MFYLILESEYYISQNAKNFAKVKLFRSKVKTGVSYVTQ